MMGSIIQVHNIIRAIILTPSSPITPPGISPEYTNSPQKVNFISTSIFGKCTAQAHMNTHGCSASRMMREASWHWLVTNKPSKWTHFMTSTEESLWHENDYLNVSFYLALLLSLLIQMANFKEDPEKSHKLQDLNSIFYLNLVSIYKYQKHFKRFTKFHKQWKCVLLLLFLG